MTRLNPALTTLFLLFMVGCANQPADKQRYFLPSVEMPSQQQKTAPTRLLQISEVRLADFLDQPGLVLQLDDITLNQAQNHVWAEDLRQQIYRGLRKRLNQRQQDFLVVGPQTSADLRLSLTIDAFHARHDGQALTSGQWQLINAQGEIVSLQDFNFDTRLAEPGYPALVRALDSNLDDLITALIEILRKQ